MRKLANISIIIIFFSFGCATPKNITTGQVMPDYRFPKDLKYVVIDILDGQERGQSPSYGSGQAMVSALIEELMKHGYSVTSIPSKDLSDGFKEAERLGYSHVAKGVFTHWEDNATEWSSNPDRVIFSLEIFAVKDHRLVGSSTHQIEASGFALFSASPTRFIPELAQKTLARILDW
jgi:hypothetical protein